jgi:hypothetical protein
MTWRSTATRVALSHASTWRSSSGMARTATVPVCGLVMTVRPSPLPTSARSAAAVSAQKSVATLVLSWLLSCCCTLLLLPPLPEAPAPVLPAAPPLPPLPPLPIGAAPELTRTSLRPLRWWASALMVNTRVCSVGGKTVMRRPSMV